MAFVVEVTRATVQTGLRCTSHRVTAGSAVTDSAFASVLIDTVNTSTTVQTWIRPTPILVLTVPTRVSGKAVADVAMNTVHARSIIVTRVGITLVDVCLTVDTAITVTALTCILVIAVFANTAI